MNERIEVTAKQAVVVVGAVMDARDSAASCAARLAMAGLGESALWLRLDALEAEFASLLDGLRPTLFLEQLQPVGVAVVSAGVAGDEGAERPVAQAVADIGHQ